MNRIILLILLTGLWVSRGWASETQVQGQPLNIDSLKIVLEVVQDDQERYRVLHQIVDHQKDNDYDQALIFAEKALKLAEKLGNHDEILRSALDLAGICYGRSDFRKALDYTRQAEQLASRNGQELKQAEVQMLYGKIYQELGDYPQSIEFYFNALKISEKSGDQQGVATALNSIGKQYHIQHQYDKAMEYFFKALNLSKSLKDSTGIGRGLGNIATIYAKRGDLQNALRYTREAVQINRRTGMKLWEGINYYNMGGYFLAGKSYDSALFYLISGQVIFSELNNIPMLYRSLLDLSDYYLVTGNLLKATEQAEQAYEYGRKYGLKKSLRDAAESLHRLYVRSGQYQKAYEFLLVSGQMHDSLNLQESIRTITRLELKASLERAAREAELKNRQKDLVFLIIILIMIVIASLASFFYFRQKISARNETIAKLNLENEVDLKNKELVLNVLHLAGKNELIGELMNKLNGLQSLTTDEKIKDEIQKIMDSLQLDQSRKTLNEFELRFKGVHTDFFEKLLQKYPTLTPNELKLCAFLRLNMTTKEISSITGQRTDAIDIARHRLRAKFGLTNTNTNLIIFLSNL
jgi:tetratricopeptide (TPR) repeat protein